MGDVTLPRATVQRLIEAAQYAYKILDSDLAAAVQDDDEREQMRNLAIAIENGIKLHNQQSNLSDHLAYLPGL
jgi:hypothetical protein